MRGLDLAIFDFDYDLTWTALFITPEGEVLGRHGDKATSSLAGLRFSLEKALEQFDRRKRVKPFERKADRLEDYPAARRFSATACLHCHHVHEFRREQKQLAGTWTRDDFWIYPEANNLGISLDEQFGNRVRTVAAASLAQRAGLRPGDVLETVEQSPIASSADLRYALHRAGREGKLALTWLSSGQRKSAAVALPANWKESDISWRWSLKSLQPTPQVQGDDLTADEKRSLGLQPEQLALRQNAFLSLTAQQAGLRTNDVIVGINGKDLKMTA